MLCTGPLSITFIHSLSSCGRESGHEACFTHLNKFWCQFEGRALEAKVVSWGMSQDEPKVNVDDVTLRVQEDIPVVSVYVCVSVCVCVCVCVCVRVCDLLW